MFKPDRIHKFSRTDVPKTIRFTEGIDQELFQLHEQTGISFNQVVLQCCRYALDNLELEKEEEN